jgi:hypothetical protein
MPPRPDRPRPRLMRTTQTVDVEIRVTPWVTIEPAWDTAPWLAAYRIWIMHDARFDRWCIRHEWEHRGGNRARTSKDWIPGPRGWSNAAEPAPGEEPPP